MKCLACGYDLSGVAADVSPECGAKRPTLLQHADTKERRRFAKGLVIAHGLMAAPYLLSAIFAYSAAVRAMFQLGRWPRWHQDNPSRSALGSPFTDAWNISSIFAFYTFPLWICVAIGTFIMMPRLRAHAPSRAVMIYCVMSVPLLFVMLFFLDPGGVFFWIAD